MTQKKVDIWMPLYIADYLLDTSRLTTEQHGAYMFLIMDYWKNGALPDNDDILRSITKMSPDGWGNARAILQAFFKVKDGRWIHSRIERELIAAREKRDAASEKGKKGAENRWKNGTGIGTGIAQAMPDYMPRQCSSPSPTQVTNTDTSPDGDKSDKIDYQAIVDLYHKHLPELPSVRHLTAKRRSAIKTCATTKKRYSELDFWEHYFRAVKKSDFLMGKTSNWKADFDFLVTHSKFIKVIEGAYK